MTFKPKAKKQNKNEGKAGVNRNRLIQMVEGNEIKKKYHLCAIAATKKQMFCILRGARHLRARGGVVPRLALVPARWDAERRFS